MKILYKSDKVKQICTSVKHARQFFGGNEEMVKKLLSRICMLEAADTLKDIVMNPVCRFHNLHKKNGKDLFGCFAIDVKSIKEPWRIILEPLDENEGRYSRCRIDEIVSVVRIVMIMEVSNHYE